MPSCAAARPDGDPAAAPWWQLGAVLVLASAAIAVVSWLAADWTRNDFERLDDLRRAFLFFGLFGSAAGAYWGTYTQRAVVPQRPLLVTTVLCTAAFFVAFPVGSKDVFGYALFGKLWGQYGANPLVTAPAAFPDDPWLPFLGDVRWRNWPVVYGPLSLCQAWVIDRLAGDSLWTSVWLYKAAATLALAATLGLAASVLRGTPGVEPTRWAWALLAWNPLLLFETAGNAHNDIVMVLAVCGAVWCRQRERPRAALSLLAVAFWYKWYSLLFVPAFVVDRAGRAWRGAAGDALVAAAVGVVVGLLALSPLPGSLSAIVTGLLAPKALQGIYPHELSPVLAPLFWGLEWMGAFASPWGVWLFNVVRGALFVLVAVAITWRQWRAGPSVPSLVEACCLWAAAFVLLIMTMLLPWHLLVVIVLAILAGREPFFCLAVGLTVLGLASYFLTFGVATLTMALVAAALWGLRRRR